MFCAVLIGRYGSSFGSWTKVPMLLALVPGYTVPTVLVSGFVSGSGSVPLAILN